MNYQIPGNTFGFKHGHASPSKGGRTRTYRSWELMRSRCQNPKSDQYPEYGAKGIHVCDSWQDFLVFLADMGESPPDCTLDRYPNKAGNYEPGNCRWATAKEQARNRRDNVLLTHGGRTQSAAAWCEELGLDYPSIVARVSAGWDADRALMTPTKVCAGWSDDALNVLRQHYRQPKGIDTCCQLLPDRTRMSIRKAAIKHGIAPRAA